MQDSEQPLMDYLKNDIAHLKVRNEMDRREAERWFTFSCGLAVALVLSFTCFAGAICYVAHKQTAQMQALIDGGYEVETVTEKITQDVGAKADGGSNITQTINQNGVSK